jgi:NAD(P)-dependent dehydrogenase (short-subunit alcohol dehydrogenase family)
MFTPMKIEIEHEGSCLGATGGTGRLIVRDALAKGHSVVVLVRKRSIFLSIIHIFSAQQEADLDIGKTGHASPDDGVSWRGITGTVQVAAEARELYQTGL